LDSHLDRLQWRYSESFGLEISLLSLNGGHAREEEAPEAYLDLGERQGGSAPSIRTEPENDWVA